MTYRVLRDLPFAEYVGFRPVTLDLHLPEGEGPHPVVLQLHGGGWRGGRRGQFSPLVAEADSFGRLVAAGFAVAAADYRLSGEIKFPGQLEDVERALTWVRANAESHGLDASRIVLWGVSAGGTLAALVGLDSPAGVRGVVDWYGVSDLLEMARFSEERGGGDETREDLWIGAPVRHAPETAAAASPALRVRSGAPPFQLLHGADDPVVPPRQSELFGDALRRAGVEVELHLEPDVGHFWRGATPEQSDALFDRSIEFARRVTA